MSFETVCHSCGAPSGPSVGVCPFCKSVMTSAKGKDHPTVAKIKKFYADGNLEKALLLADMAFHEKKALSDNVDFLMTYGKILLETEGPLSRCRKVFTQAYLHDPENGEANEYIEITDAKFRLRAESNDQGERELRNIVRRSPKNVHAKFVLATHLFWVSKIADEPERLLQDCVRLRPNFLRAWGCLSAIYRAVGNHSLEQYALRRCIALEKNNTLREYFKKSLERSLAKSAA